MLNPGFLELQALLYPLLQLANEPILDELLGKELVGEEFVQNHLIGDLQRGVRR